MATLNGADLPSDDSEDEDYEDDDGDSDTKKKQSAKNKGSVVMRGVGGRVGGRGQIGGSTQGTPKVKVKKQIMEARAARIFEEMLEESRKEVAHHPTVTASDFMLQFHKRQPPRTNKQNSTLEELSHYLRIGVGECSSGDGEDIKQRVPHHIGKGGEGEVDESEIGDLVAAAMRDVKDGGDEVVVMRDVRYAGQTTRVQQKVQRGSRLHMNIQKENDKSSSLGGAMGGLDAFMNEVTEKKKITSVAKSQADWLAFREASGLDEDLRKNRKDGYLNKQRFLDSSVTQQEEAELALKRRCT